MSRGGRFGDPRGAASVGDETHTFDTPKGTVSGILWHLEQKYCSYVDSSAVESSAVQSSAVQPSAVQSSSVLSRSVEFSSAVPGT